MCMKLVQYNGYTVITADDYGLVLKHRGYGVECASVRSQLYMG